MASKTFALIIATMFPAMTLGGENEKLDRCIAFEARVYQGEVLEWLPLVIHVKLMNICAVPKPCYYRQSELDRFERWSVLQAVSTSGVTYSLSYYGGAQPSETAPMPIPLTPGATIEADFVRSLIFRRPPPPRWAGDLRELLEPIPPGFYVGHFEASAPGGRKLMSNEFEFVVQAANGDDMRARDRMTIAYVDFLEGRDAPLHPSHFDGRTLVGKVNVSRFGELQRILDDFPNSTYAKWIRFWKLYHHGPVDDALEYARQHRDFPLSDNLMLRMADRLFHQAGKYDRAAFNRVRDLVAELLRDFPDGDTRARALILQEKLTKKP